MGYEKYKGYSIPVFNLDNLNKITKEDLLCTDFCAGVSISDHGDKYECNGMSCKSCLLVQSGWEGGSRHARDTFIEYVIENGYLSSADALELSLDYLSKKE